MCFERQTLLMAAHLQRTILVALAGLASGCRGDERVGPAETDSASAGTEASTTLSSAGTESSATTGSVSESADTTSGATGSVDCDGPGVTGRVADEAGVALPGARVTLFTADLAMVVEVRTDAQGQYTIDGASPGDLRLGASLRDRAYVEEGVTLGPGCVELDFVLGPETEPGRWTTIGDTAPEFFAGTPSGTLLPDGRVMFCHDTQDAVIIDPADGSKSYADSSPSSQGCHMQTVLADGRVLFVGGQDPEDPGAFTNGIPYVKTYDPATDSWTQLPDLGEPRWYPALFRLADETIVACGGGQPPDASRTDTCERLDPGDTAWDPTGSMLNPTEYSPTALLFTGEVLATWSPPQLFDPVAGQWRAAGNFVQPDRLWPGHADHTLVVLADGDALAVGVRANAGSAMVERYDPAADAWAAGASPDVVRSQAEVVALPDGRILAAGGFWEGGSSVNFDPGWPAVATSDLYDPDRDAWRNVADMLRPREYHALTLLLPDGRVITTSGGSDQAVGPGSDNSVDVFDPPYLFRGPRPTLFGVPGPDLVRGSTVAASFSRTEAPTAIVMTGASAVTHWVDGGIPRRVELSFSITSPGQLAIEIEQEEPILPLGWYVLWALVDDIPSEGVLVRVTG